MRRKTIFSGENRTQVKIEENQPANNAQASSANPRTEVKTVTNQWDGGRTLALRPGTDTDQAFRNTQTSPRMRSTTKTNKQQKTELTSHFTTTPGTLLHPFSSKTLLAENTCRPSSDSTTRKCFAPSLEIPKSLAQFHFKPECAPGEEPNPESLFDLRKNHGRDYLKKRHVRIFDGKWSGLEGIFQRWSGTVAYILINDIGDKALSVERKIQVLP
eukprot:TRINITY_DN5876_c0_g1_i2.p1 TRINITY_DN5876_c0_g1~~TRINITY_DN5876_c0_g1_i2.p1  ORF type:complete len:215 (-),score=24.12 TRINITY_DN5876_c0_g1_i2:19-663(-)